MQVVDATTFKLRAERDSARSGRTYTVTYRATDACGNSATRSATVSVAPGSGPHGPLFDLLDLVGTILGGLFGR